MLPPSFNMPYWYQHYSQTTEANSAFYKIYSISYQLALTLFAHSPEDEFYELTAYETRERYGYYKQPVLRSHMHYMERTL